MIRMQKYLLFFFSHPLSFPPHHFNFFHPSPLNIFSILSSTPLFLSSQNPLLNLSLSPPEWRGVASARHPLPHHQRTRRAVAPSRAPPPARRRGRCHAAGLLLPISGDGGGSGRWLGDGSSGSGSERRLTSSRPHLATAVGVVDGSATGAAVVGEDGGSPPPLHIWRRRWEWMAAHLLLPRSSGGGPPPTQLR